MKQYSEFELQRALADARDGRPISRAAQQWGIPYHTLYYRLKRGRQSRNAAFADMQRLTQSQEDNLVAYILTQEALGCPISHGQLKGLAERMLGDGQQPLGRKWMRRFLRRNPLIRTKRSRAIDARRWRAHSPEIIQQFLDRLDIPEIKGIHPSNRWNIDETGIMEGKGTNGLVLGSAASRYI